MDPPTRNAHDDAHPPHALADEAQTCHPDWEITPRRVEWMIGRSDDFLLLDCRTPEEDAIARIDGGELLPMQDLPHRLDDLREHEARPIVVYCHTGRRSLMVTSVLRAQGFADVRSMAGGIDRWSLEVDRSMPRY
jgi:rhodanese-related sulfurtransferase